MEEELNLIVGQSVMSGISSDKTTVKLAKALKYYHTHLNMILLQLEDEDIPDMVYLEEVIKNGEKILIAEDHDL